MVTHSLHHAQLVADGEVRLVKMLIVLVVGGNKISIGLAPRRLDVQFVAQVFHLLVLLHAQCHVEIVFP